MHPLNNFIHPEAQLGTNVKVEHFSSIYENVIIGDNTWIGPNVSIFPGSRIGKDCKIFPGAVIGAIPQDLKFHGETSLVEIGDRVVIRECATVNRGTEASGTTKVGNDTMLMAYVHVAHDCIIGEHCILANSTNLAGHVTIEDYINSVGLKRHNFTAEEIHMIQDAYRFIFGNKGLNTSQALQKITEEIPPSALRDYILNFIKTSDRGIIKGID
ncbi:MAG: acyl-[acyl-carrier-protein]--UDP-N-acetylglucosamine O-acyltransferase [Sphingobacteriales bacterium]|nr:acyl-[acyl-carrier-protein]--UDP-N-acetylglucosamine O-acyltransferase [Sphingobacteriales bacterium]